MFVTCNKLWQCVILNPVLHRKGTCPRGCDIMTLWWSLYENWARAENLTPRRPEDSLSPPCQQLASLNGGSWRTQVGRSGGRWWWCSCVCWWIYSASPSYYLSCPPCYSTTGSRTRYVLRRLFVASCKLYAVSPRAGRALSLDTGDSGQVQTIRGGPWHGEIEYCAFWRLNIIIHTWYFFHT